MFGDKAIFGKSELCVDDKGRVIVPQYTNREIGEELILLYNEDFKIYEIYSVKRLKERFDELNNLILNSETIKKRKFYEMWLLKLSKSILKSVKVEKNGTITLDNHFNEYEKVISTGAYDHLIIEPIKLKK